MFQYSSLLASRSWILRCRICRYGAFIPSGYPNIYVAAKGFHMLLELFMQAIIKESNHYKANIQLGQEPHMPIINDCMLRTHRANHQWYTANSCKNILVNAPQSDLAVQVHLPPTAKLWSLLPERPLNQSNEVHHFKFQTPSLHPVRRHNQFKSPPGSFW